MGKIVYELSGDEKKLIASFRKAGAEQEKLRKGAEKGIVTTKRAGTEAKKLGAEYGRTGKKGKEAFGATAVSSLTRFAAGVFGISKAVQGVTASFREMDQARAEAARRGIESRQGLGALAQLAETEEERDKLVAMSKRIFAGGGAATLDEAARVAFALQSAGVQKEAQLFTDLRSAGVIDQPGVMARAVKTMISSFGGEEAGDVRQIISKAFAASKFNPAVVEPLLEAAAGAGGFARALGISDEEVLAAVALQAEETGTPSGGGTRVTALLRQIGKITEEGTGEATFAGKSLKGIIQELDRIAPTPGKLTDLLGERSESLAAFRGLKIKLDKFDIVLAEIRRAQDAGTAETKIALARGIPEVRAAEMREQGRARRELAETESGIRRNLLETVESRVETMFRDVIERSESPQIAEIFLGATRAVNRTRRFFGGDEAALRRYETALPPGPLREEVRQSLGRADQAPSSSDSGTAELTRGQQETNRLLQQQNTLIERQVQQTQRPALSNPGEDR